MATERALGRACKRLPLGIDQGIGFIQASHNRLAYLALRFLATGIAVAYLTIRLRAAINLLLMPPMKAIMLHEFGGPDDALIRVLPLKSAADAHRAIAGGGINGKLVLDP